MNGHRNPFLSLSVSLAIKTVDLSKRYGAVEALRSLSFEVPQGEVLAFLGPNSAGKTTTLKILAGIMPGSYGEATVAGWSVACEAREVKRHVGYMPEHNPLPEEATVENFLNFRAKLKELRSKAAGRRVAEVAELCDLSGKMMRRPIGVLSRGVRQRVGIADALLTEPPVLILDEPTIGLDPYQVMALRDLIRRMRGKHTIVLSTHILTEAEQMADRILIINKGQKVACGTAEELKSQYVGVNQLIVGVNLMPDEFTALLAACGGSLMRQDYAGEAGYRYHCRLKDPADAQTLLKQLASRPDVVVKEFMQPQPSLENIFIQATSHREEL